MPDVLQVITDTDRRGAQVFATDLEDALRTRRRDVKTVALVDGRSSVRLQVAHLGKRSFSPVTLRALRREALAARVVIAHGSRTLPAASMSTIGTDANLIYRGIGEPKFWVSTASRRVRTRALLRRADAVVALWPDAADSFAADFAVPREKIHIIANGVRADRFSLQDSVARMRSRREWMLDENTPVVLYMGSLTAEKNVEALIRALQMVPAAQLLVVGEGPERHHLGGLAARVAPARVRFASFTAKPAVVLAAADALVLPSLSEGMPAVLIEAALCGIPVIATSVGATAQIVLNGLTGRLVAPGDHVALADALRATLGELTPPLPAARNHVLARFEIGAIAVAWDQLLAELGAWGREASLVG
jgi:glycosyltransferase involved in cell wall biosynthesis